MELKLERFRSNENETVGRLFINGKQECYTIEDEYRKVKVKGETRIPAGRYEIKLRTEGGKHSQYLRQFSAIHKGMLHLQDVPGFEYILIHVGNTDKDTEGCICVGQMFTVYETKMMVTQSVEAYKKVYPTIAGALLNGERVHIEIVDKDK